MRRAALILTLVLGCSTDVTKDIEDLSEKACACKDATCARGVLNDLVALAKGTRNARGDEDRSNKAARKMAGCLVKAGISQDELKDAIKRTVDD